jgi:ceramide glucosyltransferase
MDWLYPAYWTAATGVIVFSMLLTWQAFEHRRFTRSRVRHHPPKPNLRHVCLFVPCKGTDDDLEANLQPLFEQDHEDYELVLIVESDDDPAAAAIRRTMRKNPHVPSRLIVAGLSQGTGQKVHNLMVATENLPPRVEILAFVDADVCPPTDWLRHLTARLYSVPVATGYRQFVPKRPTLANYLLASINGSIIPIMFPGKHHLIWGGSWAITREVFETSRLRERWRGTLSDDLIATRVMAENRFRVSAEPTCILPSPLDVDLRGMFSFIRRQLIIGRCYVSVHWYALLLGSTLVQWMFWGSAAAVLLGAVSGASWSWQPAVVALALYGLHLMRARFRHNALSACLPRHYAEIKPALRFDAWLGPLAGIAGWLGLVASAFGRRIVWKGIAYDMKPGGAITNIVRAPKEVKLAPEPAALADGVKRAA